MSASNEPHIVLGAEDWSTSKTAKYCPHGAYILMKTIKNNVKYAYSVPRVPDFVLNELFNVLAHLIFTRTLQHG